MTNSDTGQGGPSRPTAWDRFLSLLPIVADVSAIVTLLSGELSIVAMVVGALAVLFGLFLLLGKGSRLDWKLVTSSVASIVVGLVIIALAAVQLLQVPAEHGGTNGKQPAVSVPSPTPSADHPQEDQHQVLFSGDFTMQSGAGLDLDQQGRQTQSKTGATDLYLDPMRGMLGANNFIPDSGSQDDAYQRCAGAKGRRDGYPAFIPVAIVQYCFTTSEGNPAWLQVADAAHAPMAGSSGYVDISVVVWPK